MKIFISYRREDSADICGRIYDRLVQRFGKENVFKDVDSIPLGVDFGEYITGVVAQCAVQLVVIGQRWLDGGRRFGQSRLDDPKDFVRLEVEAALERHIPVIPLLVQRAPIPPANRLPPSMRDLVKHNGMPVRPDPDFEHDMSRVLAAVEHWMTQPPRPAVAAPPASTASPQFAETIPPAPITGPLAPARGARTSGPALAAARLPRRMLSLGLVAAVLVVLLFGVAMLASHRTEGTTTTNDPAGTATARQNAKGTATAISVSATSTAFVTTQYRAHVPGPGCDPGIAKWTKNDKAILQCLSDETLVTVPADDDGFMKFSSPFSDQLPSHYSVGVSVAFAATATKDDRDMCVVIGDDAKWNIWICRDGSWRVTGDWWPTTPSGSIGIWPSYQLTANVQHGAVALVINRTTIATQNGAAFDDDTDNIYLFISAVLYTATSTASAYFSDFVFNPAP